MRVTVSDFIVVLNEIRNSDRKAACVYVGGGGGGGGGGGVKVRFGRILQL